MNKFITLGLVVAFLSGCELSLRPPKYLGKIFSTNTNSRYYEKKVRFLVNQLIDQIESIDINNGIKKVAVMDLVDYKGRVPELGKYISLKIMNEISKNKYFKLMERSYLLRTMNRLNLNLESFTDSLSKELGEALQIETIIAGKIIDLGTNLDINLNFIDVKTGLIIASASESLARSNFAVEMLRQH